jgi:hypothetical protein
MRFHAIISYTKKVKIIKDKIIKKVLLDDCFEYNSVMIKNESGLNIVLNWHNTYSCLYLLND